MANEIQLAYTSGRNTYALLRDSANRIWNGSAFVPYVSGSYASYPIVLTEQGITGIYVGTFPATIPSGTYNIDFRERIGGSPAESDGEIYQLAVVWAVSTDSTSTPTGALYCTSGDVAARLSDWGVELRTDDNAATINDCIAEACSDVDLYLLPMYAAADLLKSRQVHFFARSLAAYYTCIRRNNDAPGSAQQEHDKTMDALRAVAAGTLTLAGIAKLGGGIQVSTQRYMGQLYPSLRVEKPRSTPQGRLATRRIDYTADRAVTR